jgi:hypothetical protein
VCGCRPDPIVAVHRDPTRPRPLPRGSTAARCARSRLWR